MSEIPDPGAMLPAFLMILIGYRSYNNASEQIRLTVNSVSLILSAVQAVCGTFLRNSHRLAWDACAESPFRAEQRRKTAVKNGCVNLQTHFHTAKFGGS